MMLGKIGRRIRIGTSGRFRLVGSKLFSMNNKPTIEPNKNGEKADGSLTRHKPTIEPNKNGEKADGSLAHHKPTIEPNKNGEKADGSLTPHDSYRDLENLDFMKAFNMLFGTSHKQKKFGLDFHLVQLFFVCLPSLAVYLVAQYARHEMKKMDAELERRQVEDAKKIRAAEGETLKSNPQLLEVKERLDNLEKTVKEIVMEFKNERSRKVSEQHEGDRTQHASNRVVEDRPNKQTSNKQETRQADNQKGPKGGSSHDEK